MKSLLGVAIGLLGISSAWGAEEGAVTDGLDLLKEIAGKYRVVSWSDAEGLSGSLTIKADADGVGWVSESAEMAPTPIRNLKVLTPMEGTMITKKENRIIQQGVLSERRTTVIYELHDGYLTVSSDICWPDLACESIEMVVSNGKAPGKEVDAQAFVVEREASYQVEKAGGLAPGKPETFDVDGSSDPAEGDFYAPYCEPGAGQCDLGFIPMVYSQTRVFQHSLSRGRVIYHIFVGSGAGLKYYTWDENDGKTTFINNQYILPSNKKLVALEHQLKKPSAEGDGEGEE